MVALKDTLGVLEKEAARLNDASDDLNEFLESVEQRLRASAVGVSTWLTDMIESEEIIEDDRKLYGIPIEATQAERGTVLGFIKTSGAWRLVVQDEVQWEGFDGEDGWYRKSQIISGSAPLCNAPRSIRLQAVGQLEKLVSKLADQARKFSDDIERAKTVFSE